MKIIIVGGGQIGSYITSLLLKNDHEIELKHLKTIKMPDYQKNV